MPKIRKKTSKRVSLRKKYAVDKKVKDHHKKIAKKAKQLVKAGIRPVAAKKDAVTIPNTFPDKENLINIMEQQAISMKEAVKIRDTKNVSYGQAIKASVEK